MSVEPPTSPEATVADVAALLTARTKDAAGRELGEFTAETRPTADQVQTRIDIARSLEVAGLEPIPDHCREALESCIALKAAMITEAAFWPEQVQAQQSTFERLRELYVEARAGLVLCAGGSDGGAYDLDVSGGCRVGWPVDWWQRNLEFAP